MFKKVLIALAVLGPPAALVWLLKWSLDLDQGDPMEHLSREAREARYFSESCVYVDHHYPDAVRPQPHLVVDTKKMSSASEAV